MRKLCISLFSHEDLYDNLPRIKVQKVTVKRMESKKKQQQKKTQEVKRKINYKCRELKGQADTDEGPI